MDQPEGSTLSKECFFAETDTECALCTKPDCEHYCHTDSYKFWRAADYSQIELRLLAHFSKDKLLVEAFRRGDDTLKKAANDVAKAMDVVRHNRKAPDDVNE